MTSLLITIIIIEFQQKSHWQMFNVYLVESIETLKRKKFKRQVENNIFQQMNRILNRRNNIFSILIENR